MNFALRSVLPVAHWCALPVKAECVFGIDGEIRLHCNTIVQLDPLDPSNPC